MGTEMQHRIGRRPLYLYGLGRIGELQPGGMLYHLGDALGSVRQLVDTTGAVRLAQSYEPYGSVLSSSGSGSSVFAFTGEAQDIATGLVFLRARFYAVSQGRFLTVDPSRQERNLFGYASNNPINWVDPGGLKGFWNWNQYQYLLGKRVNIAREPIGKREINAIIRNFEGNPRSDSEEYRNRRSRQFAPRHPADVYLYDTCDEVVQEFLRKRTPEDQELFPNYDLNRDDWLFSGWIDYWAWRARKATPPAKAVLTDPNILKAIALAESSIGNILPVSDPILVDPADPKKPHSLRSFMNMTAGTGFYEVLRQPNDPFFYGPRGYAIYWGKMDIHQSDRFDPVIEVGAVGRMLYAQYNNVEVNYAPGASPEKIWKLVLQGYGPGSSANDYSSCYGAQLWTLATQGVWYRGCTGVEVNRSYNTPFYGMVDLWGEHRTYSGGR